LENPRNKCVSLFFNENRSESKIKCRMQHKFRFLKNILIKQQKQPHLDNFLTLTSNLTTNSSFYQYLSQMGYENNISLFQKIRTRLQFVFWILTTSQQKQPHLHNFLTLTSNLTTNSSFYQYLSQMRRLQFCHYKFSTPL
jgi:hypothetical protein